jgi:hypothetical protein
VSAAISPLHALAAAELGGWSGLPAGLSLEEAGAELVVAADVAGTARLGAARIPVSWLAAESSVYAGGLRLYLEDDRVVVVEGRDPTMRSGEPARAPELGEPALVLDALVGPLRLPGTELVFPERGLAVQLGSGDPGLRAVLGFAPTTAEEWVERLRPEQAGRTRFPLRQVGPA